MVVLVLFYYSFFVPGLCITSPYRTCFFFQLMKNIFLTVEFRSQHSNRLCQLLSAPQSMCFKLQIHPLLNGTISLLSSLIQWM